MSEPPKTIELLANELEQHQRLVEELEARLDDHIAGGDAMRESETHFRNLSHLAWDCCWFRWKRPNGDTRRVWILDSFAEMTGYTHDEFEAIGREGLIHPDDLHDALEHVDGPFGVSEHEFRIRTKSGEERWLHERMRVTTTEDGTLCVFGATRDITDRKRAEAEQRRLELRVLHAQKLESLGVLAGGIAHDFNNILMGLLGNAELALGKLPVDSSIRPLLRDIQLAGRQAAELTAQMLAYSGKGTFVVEAVDMSSVVRDMSSLLESSTSKKVELEYELATELRAVRADASQLRQIVLNLVSNASDASGGQPGRVTVRTNMVHCDRANLDAARIADDLEEGLYVSVAVTDDGCGMDDRTLSKIFDPFFTTKLAGRGLGLASVQGIVRAHGGTISVDSAPGTGTTFEVLLPALDYCVQPADLPAEEAHSPGNGTILLADDEDLVRRAVERMLEACGYRVITASDGVDAVERFRENHDKITCVILDLRMPRMDGAEALTEIRRISNDVPVILTSGYTERDSTGEVAKAGHASFLQKPFLLADLRNTLVAAIADRVRGDT